MSGRWVFAPRRAPVRAGCGVERASPARVESAARVERGTPARVEHAPRVARARPARTGGRAAARVLRLAATLGLALLAACSRAPDRPNVLLITVDTLRADRSSLATGSARVTTPRLDALAGEGVLCTHASTPRAKTTPALASLMTGLAPHAHGVRDLMAPLALEHATLAERLHAAGWRTAAIVGNYVLQARFSGLERGFEQWTEDLPDAHGVPPEDVPQRTARSMTDGALAALGLGPATDAKAGPNAPFVRAGDPWFLWLHYMDPHGTYAPPEAHSVFRSAAPAPIDRTERTHVAEYNVPAEARLPDGRVDAARVTDLYDGEVRYVDAEIGRLLDALRARGDLANTLVIVTADHGESLGEHDDWFEHGRDACEGCVRVPLIVRFPDDAPEERRRARARCDADVSLTDLAPTLLDWLGLPPLPVANGGTAPRDARAFAAGRSVLPALLGRADARTHPVFGERVDRAELGGAVQHKTVRIGRWKLVQRWAAPPPDRGGKPTLLSEALYDVERDPREERDLAVVAASAEPGAAADAPLGELRALLLAFTAADARFAELADDLARERARLEAVDPEALRILKGLGY
ncbi:MAG: sulfatase [Planctomycetes bacterium]|nr:sulfatase [Planctomycetota bacterium]